MAQTEPFRMCPERTPDAALALRVRCARVPQVYDARDCADRRRRGAPSSNVLLLVCGALCLPGNGSQLADPVVIDSPPETVLVCPHRYCSISARVSTETLTPTMTVPPQRADQRKALLLLRRFLFRFAEYSYSHPESRSYSDSAPLRKAARTVSFRPPSRTAPANVLIAASRPVAAN